MLQKFDKLFTMKSNVDVIPIKQFFAEMGMTDDSYDSRVDLATKLREDYKFVLNMMLVALYFEQGIDRNGLVNSLNDRLSDTIAKHIIESAEYDIRTGQIDVLFESTEKYLSKQLQAESEEFIDVAMRHLDDEYYFSDDRATISAENEVNSVMNYADFFQAKQSGKQYKTWRTMEDYRVRDTHKALANLTIPIDTPFYSMGSQMMFPRDESLNADSEEIVGCRCWATYE